MGEREGTHCKIHAVALHRELVEVSLSEIDVRKGGTRYREHLATDIHPDTGMPRLPKIPSVTSRSAGDVEGPSRRHGIDETLNGGLFELDEPIGGVIVGRWP